MLVLPESIPGLVPRKHGLLNKLEFQRCGNSFLRFRVMEVVECGRIVRRG